MRAIVTGGAGFIGSNVADGLIAANAEVLVIDDLSSGSESNLAGAVTAGASLARIDIRDLRSVTSAFRAFAPDVVFHLAQIGPGSPTAEPALDAAVNVAGSVNVFTAAAASGVRRVVNTGTGAHIYGTPAVIPTPESEPARPTSAYGLSRRTAEEYGSWFRDHRGLDVVSLRYADVYGPRQDPGGRAGVVARLCERVLGGRRSTVFGDGGQTRDHVYVADVVAATIAVATAPALPHDRYNIGSGTEVGVLELVAAVAGAAGVAAADFAPEFAPARAGELRRACLDVSRARADLALAAPTPLTVGLRHTLEWMRSLR